MTLFVLLFVLEGLVAGQLTDQQETLAAGLLAAFALMFGVAMILPVCFELAFANRRREWAAFGAARARRWISGIAIFIPAAIVIGAVAIAITNVLHLTGTNDLGADHSGLGYKIALSALAVMVAPWTEEVAMRGFLFSALARRFGFWPGALVSGVVWAGLHVEPGVLILFSAEGMLLAWLRRLDRLAAAGDRSPWQLEHAGDGYDGRRLGAGAVPGAAARDHLLGGAVDAGHAGVRAAAGRHAVTRPGAAGAGHGADAALSRTGADGRDQRDAGLVLRRRRLPATRMRRSRTGWSWPRRAPT